MHQIVWKPYSMSNISKTAPNKQENEGFKFTNEIIYEYSAYFFITIHRLHIVKPCCDINFIPYEYLISKL